MALEDLLEAIGDEQPPCYGCSFAIMCLYNKLLCSDFQHYVQDTIPIKKSRVPSRKLYNDVWPDFVGYSEERHGS